MTSACSMGFSSMADRIVWPPSLSRDRKFAGGPPYIKRRNLVFDMNMILQAYRLTCAYGAVKMRLTRFLEELLSCFILVVQLTRLYCDVRSLASLLYTE